MEWGWRATLNHSAGIAVSDGRGNPYRKRTGCLGGPTGWVIQPAKSANSGEVGRRARRGIRVAVDRTWPATEISGSLRRLWEPCLLVDGSRVRR